MKKSRYLSLFLGFITLIMLVFGYLEYVHNLGFPDGYISEFSRAGKIFYKILVGPFLTLGLYFIYLGWNASKQKINKKLIIAVIILIFCIAAVVIIDNYLFLHLDHGQGG